MMLRVRAGLLLLVAWFGLGAAVPQSPARAPSPVRPVGTIAGTLRHKGCATTPAGATVSVVGRDAVVEADAAGRFSLTLPPGSYSIVINGPGLVPDQRVDDVAVVAGESRDVGTVEVWPAEPPPGCTPGAPSTSNETAVVAVAGNTPTVDLPGESVAPAPAATAQVWVRGGNGTGAGEFGLQGDLSREDEDALGPSTFALGPQGSLYVLDGLNGRIERFDTRGRPASAFPVEPRGEEPALEADLAVSDEGNVFLFHQNDILALEEYEPSGRLLVSGLLPPSFKGVDFLFALKLRPIFLMQNGQAVRADLSWGGIRAEGPLPGLPANNLFVRAERLDRWRVAVSLAGADGRVRRSIQLHSLVPVSGVRLVGVGHRGEVVVAIDRSEGSEGTTPRAEVLLTALDPHLHLAGFARAPPGNRRFEFREFALAGDGTVVQMQSDVTEVRFVRWVLQHPTREQVEGEGLVRGRVVDPLRGLSGVTVSLTGRSRRAFAPAEDGSFEVRVPAGTWVVAVRRTPVAGAPEAPPVEVKVTVAAGATVDVGTLTLGRAPHPVPPTSEPSAPSALGLP